MAKLTIAFGILLVLLGATGYRHNGQRSPYCPHPERNRHLLCTLRSLGEHSEDSKKRMLWMHISVTLALLVFLGMIPSAIDTLKLSRGAIFPHPIAVEEKGALCFFCLIYVLFCVRSFISCPPRSTRLTAPPA